MSFFLMDFSAAHVLPTCSIEGDTDIEGACCGETKLRPLPDFTLLL